MITKILMLAITIIIIIFGFGIWNLSQIDNSDATAGTVVYDLPTKANIVFNENLDIPNGIDFSVFGHPAGTFTGSYFVPDKEPSPLMVKYRKLELLRFRKEYDQQKEQEKIDKLRIQIKEELLQYLKECPPMIINVEIKKDKILIIIIKEEPERAIGIYLSSDCDAGDCPIGKFSSWSILLIQSKMPEIKKEIERQIDEEIKELEKE